MGKDIPGDRKLLVGLTHIKGIGKNFANAIIRTLDFNPDGNIGFLTDAQVEKIENVLKDPASINFPAWMFNRRKDVETGNTMHLISADIDFTVRNDIEREKQVNSWRGFRHMYGLKVRGQRTRTTGRKGASVGVRKGGKVMPAAAPAAPAAAAPAAAPAAPAAAPAAKPETKEKK